MFIQFAKGQKFHINLIIKDIIFKLNMSDISGTVEFTTAILKYITIYCLKIYVIYIKALSFIKLSW